MKKAALLAFLLFSVLSSQAQYLQIVDPQSWWRAGQGTIEETKITYEPHGLYMKMDWEITFSARGIYEFSEFDTVEVEYLFRLPEGSMIIDSWLWFGDTILKADIIDRWSATEIYEEIVGRRKDPSILFKNSSRDYELRIFPMAAKESRKVKLTILLPTEWNASTVSTAFPPQNLTVSRHSPDVNIFIKLPIEWTTPVIAGERLTYTDNFYDFEIAGTDTTHHIFHKEIDSESNQKFSVSSPLEKRPYLSIYEKNDEHYYQLAFVPLKEMSVKKEQKILFLFDYQKENSDLSQAEMLGVFKESLTSYFNEKDSFNILYHDFQLQKASDTWIAGDSASISDALLSLGEDPFVSYSNIATLLASGIEMASAAGDVKIILISNTDKMDDIPSANQLISDLLALADPVVPVLIADFQTKNYKYYYANGINYRGNEYFYRNLAKLTGGDYRNTMQNNTFSDCFNEIYHSASESGMIDIHTSLANGFCYGRTRLEENEKLFSNMAYLEIGKYNGEFPFEIDISGEYAGEIFSSSLTISKEDAVSADSVLKQIWMGNEIQALENSSHHSSYVMINEIIEKSLANRILSRYTAFLALEPGMQDLLNQDDDEEFTLETEELTKTPAEIKVYPNPFTDRVNIEVSLSEDLNRDEIKLEIYDMFGKLIKTFDAEQFEMLSEINIEWDATNENGIRVPNGFYLFVCTTPEGRITKKLGVM